MASSFLEQKAKAQAEKLEKQYGPTAYGGTTWLKEQEKKRKKKKEDEGDIAPVLSTSKDERTWFQKGAFDDGYQLGDISKTILGTLTDVGENLTAGVLGMGEKAIDAGAYAVGGVGGLFGNDDLKSNMASFIKKDLYNEEAIAKKIIIGTDENSVLGEKSDGVVQSVGQYGAQLALQAVGVPWFVTSGITAFGGEVESALNEDASFMEAGISGAITAGGEILGEKFFGGVFGETGMDDALIKHFSRTLSSKLARSITTIGIKGGGEAFEEAFSWGIGNLGKKLTYADEKTWKEMFTSEEAVDELVESVVGGFLIGGGKSTYDAVKATKAGVDYATGLTSNEQKVIDKEYENRIKEQEQDGRKLTEKEKSKIYDAVVSDMEKGYISTDTIEEVLGGDTYKAHKDTLDREKAMQEEYDTLYKMKNMEKSDEQIDRQAELKKQLDDLKQNFNRNELRDSVMSLVKDDRLAESYNERTRRGQAFEADVTKYDSKQQATIQKAVESGILNNTNRTHEFVDMIAKISADKGVLFDFTNNERLKESGFAVEGKTVNGFVNENGVSLNIDSAKSLNSVVGHEITHVLEGTQLYTEMQKAIVDYAKHKGDYKGRMDTIKRLYANQKNTNLEAELTADLVGDYLFTDSDFIHNLSTNHRNVFQKIYDEIKYLCKVATAGSKEARELEKVKRAFEKAYQGANKSQGDASTQYSLVEDQATIDFLENQEYLTTYKAMVLIDGKLYPPMASQNYVEETSTNKKGETKTKRVRKLKNPSVLGRWQQSEERTDLITKMVPPSKKYPDGYGSFDLLKSNGKTTKDVAYNPYEHTSNIVLNDQFSEAYQRPELVTVEYHIPVSELTSGYKAQYAKDPVGLTDWKAGGVAQDLKNSHRDVYLTRWAKPVRILPDSEVAQKYKEILDKEDGIAVPWNVVTPSLREELEKIGVPIDYSDFSAGGNIRSFEAWKRGDYDKKGKKAKYSLSDSDGKQLSKEQQDYFKDSKIRDENGRLRVVYHGTNTGDFTVFNPDYIGMSSGDDGFFGMGFYFAYSKGEAAYYGAKRIIPAYLNLKNPFNFDRELQTYNGKKARSGYAPDAVALMNFADKFPEIAKDVTIGVVEKGSDEVKDLSLPEFAEAFKDVIENKSFEYQEMTNEYGEKETLVLADPETHEYEYGGVKHSYKDYGFQKRFWGEANELDVAYEYLSNSVYNYVDMLSRTRLILDKNREFTAALKQMGYDGAIQSEYGDEAVAFYPEQIKNTDNLNPTADPDIRYSLSDSDYLDAVNRGDTDSAQMMVDEAAKNAGYTVKAYHGTARADRVGNVFLPERATSGPMAFFTDNKGIAENYARDKQDTSMAYDPDFDRYETQFRIKAGTMDIPLYKAWSYLPFAARKRITEKAGQLREDWDGDNELMLDPDTNEANGGFQWQLKEARGNAIQALTEQWLNSGTLFNEEARFLDVLEMTGVTEEVKKVNGEVYFKDPNVRHEKVYDTYLKINKPFDTAKVDEQFVAELEAWYDEQDQSQYDRENMQSDMWDKNGIDAYDFAERLRNDIERGTAHAWTSIPDSVTDYLKHLGYDGIKDTGGKNGGEIHTVWIPFSSEQVKSAEAVARDDSGNVIPLSERFNPEKTDIRYSVSGNDRRTFGNYNVYGKDVALETAPEIAPVAVAENATTTEDSTSVAKNVASKATSEDIAPMSEPIPGQFDSLTDADAPVEMDAPYYGDEEAETTVDDPFENRYMDEVGKQSVKAYMYENPEVKPFFQQEAAIMLRELQESTKGQKLYNDQLYYDTNGEKGWFGQSRNTSDEIAYLLDGGWGGKGYTYAEIEKGLKAIIEDNGKENNACSKRIEFLLNDRLRDGYTDFRDGSEIPPDEGYLALLKEKQITEYSKEAFDALVAMGEEFVPPVQFDLESDEPAPAPEPILPKENEVGGTTKRNAKGQQRIEPKPNQDNPQNQQRLWNEKTARILPEEPKKNKNQRGLWSMFKEYVLDNGMIFEDLSLKTGNRELQAKWNFIRNASSMAQTYMGKGKDGTRALNDIRQEVEKSGKMQAFSEYAYHMLNVDRMTLAQRYEGMENKPVFGKHVTAAQSASRAVQLEKANPEFKKWAQELYDINTQLREMLVEGNVLSRETANQWAEMYPHYIPIRRAGYEGAAINVALDTKRTGVNAPIKKATGGNRDILPLFDTMGQRAIQTHRAIAKNRFGLELRKTLGTTISEEMAGMDSVIDSMDNEEGLLKKGDRNNAPTFTVFENGKRYTFEITDEMYDSMKPTSDLLAYTNPVLSKANSAFRGLLTEYNPVFMLSNAVKDAQDVLINSQHPARTYMAMPKAIGQMMSGGNYYREYMENGGEQNTYFDSQTDTFNTKDTLGQKLLGIPPLKVISWANNVIERLPRMAEYIASREDGRSIEVSMLDAARVTTNFAAGGKVTKALNRNGATFLNASVQGAVQQARNIREAKANGLKGVIALAAKVAVAGLPSMLVNHLLWDDDEDYEELSDYVKQSYYIVGKYGDGQFVRIPKGRMLAVIQNGFEQMENLVTGDDEVDLKAFLELAVSNIAPNNPVEDNILAPIMQVKNNKTWYGEDLIPTRLADLPKEEQFDESTDSISKWLGEKQSFLSPYQINYLLDQYSGGVGDVFLPMRTPEAESGDNTFVGNLLAPMKKKFTADSVMNNQNVSDFYDTKDELTTNAKASKATDEDILKSKYINSISSELSDLYALKREVQNSDLADDAKYEAVRDIQKQIVDLTSQSLEAVPNVSIAGDYAEVGNRQYRRNDDGEWVKLSDKQAEKQDDVTSGLNISASEYWSNKEEYDFAFESPEKYAVAKTVGGYDAYKDYTKQLYDIKADKDENGKSITGSRKEKVLDWINELDADYYTKIILWKREYTSDDSYNYEIINYLNGRSDISREEMEAILRELGFEVDKNGNISW